MLSVILNLRSYYDGVELSRYRGRETLNKGKNINAKRYE